MAVTESSATIEVITGPTASGKSALALRRAAEDPTIEIVSADAFQIYRGFDIGTAKSTADEQRQVKHHLIDILDPKETYSAGEYARQGRATIEQILAENKRPVVVGGTGLYIDALFFGMASLDVDESSKQKGNQQYKKELQEFGFDELHRRLQPIDPELYTQIARERNPLRLERAWTHYYATGVPLGVARQRGRDTFRHKPHFTLLIPEREDLRQRIAQRIDDMLAAGWLDEVRSLLNAGVNTTMPSMRAIGYQELAKIIEGTLRLEEARQLIIDQTRQYAKRQMTWMKRYHEHE